MYYENFKELCNKKGVRPSDISKETGISTVTLSDWKKGKYTPKQDKLKLIADYFGVSVEYLMTGEESDTPHFSPRTRKLITLLAKLPEDRLIEVEKFAEYQQHASESDS